MQLYFKPSFMKVTKKMHFRSVAFLFLIIMLRLAFQTYGLSLIPGKPLTDEEFFEASKLKDLPNLPVTESDLFGDDIMKSPVIRHSFSIENSLWPEGVVPYVLDEKYDKKSRVLIAKAFQEFQNKTCIRFVPKSNEKDFIVIENGKGCSSYVGRQGDLQPVVLGEGCRSLGIIMHEIMHTLGFIHEHSREDRDAYISVIWENVKRGREDNFKTWNWYSNRILEAKYDYSSILHYHRFTFSKDPKNKPTLVPKMKNVDIGQRKYLSKGDIRKINTAYKCPTKLFL